MKDEWQEKKKYDGYYIKIDLTRYWVKFQEWLSKKLYG